MIKKLSAFIFAFIAFLSFPLLAFASDFTVSNVTYNPISRELIFDISGLGGTSVDFTSGSAYLCLGNVPYSANYGCDPSATAPACTNTHCDVTLSSNFDLTYADGNTYLINLNNGTSYSSQNFILPTSTVQIVADPSSPTATVGTPFKVDVKATHTSAAFNAAQATVTLSSNLSITGLNYPSSNSCNFNYTKRPTTTDPSFAGAIFGGSSTGCTVYTLTLTPTSTDPGTITFTNGSVKSYTNGSEILTGVQNASFTINAATPTPTPPGTTLVTVDDSVQGTNQDQWNYVGSWSHCTDATSCNSNSLYNNSTSWDNTTDDYATISFTGIQASLYGLTDPNHGIGAVSIDGGAETNVDFYSATRTGNVLLWTSPLLTQGQHTLKVRVTGTKSSSSDGTYVAIDRGDMLQTSSSSFTVTNSLFDTYGPTFTLMGTKDASLSSIVVNGSSSNSTYPTSTSWQAVEPVVLGNNNFTIYGVDANNDQTTSINVTVNMHNLGDINGDNVVDLTDASLFAVDWGKTSNLTYPLSDMNGDGSVDLTDFSILAKQETL